MGVPEMVSHPSSLLSQNRGRKLLLPCGQLYKHVAATTNADGKSWTFGGACEPAGAAHGGSRPAGATKFGLSSATLSAPMRPSSGHFP
jgi:hypothetical protein